MSLFGQRPYLALAAVALVPLLATPRRAEAQGFQLNDVGSCAVARGYATTGAPCKDASDIYWNPGAATDLTGFSFYGGAAVLASWGASPLIPRGTSTTRTRRSRRFRAGSLTTGT